MYMLLYTLYYYYSLVLIIYRDVFEYIFISFQNILFLLGKNISQGFQQVPKSPYLIGGSLKVLFFVVKNGP